MLIPFYKAKIAYKDKYVEGFYYAYPEITYCFTSDYEKNPSKILHFLCTYSMTDWGLPNNSKCYRIDPDTLEQIGYFDSEIRNYNGTNLIIKEIEYANK